MEALQPEEVPTAVELAPEDKLEPALRDLLEHAGAAGGAVCLYDRRQEVLRLAVEIGLSDQGCRLLRTIRADAESWGAPLRSLTDRRVRVIDVVTAPTRIPALLPDDRPFATVACVPLCVDGRPVGCVVLAASVPGALTEESVDALTPRVSAIADIVDTIYRRVAAAQDEESPGSRFDALAEMALRGIEPVVQEVASRLAGWARDIPVVRRLALLAPSSEDAERIRRLQLEVGILRTECRRLAELADQSEDLSVRLALAESVSVREQRRAEALDREREQLAAQCLEAMARERRVREELDSISQRSSEGREETLRRAREMTVAAEDQRAAAVAEAEATRAALATCEATILSLREEIRHAWAEANRQTDGARQARLEQEQLQAKLDELRTTSATAATRTAGLDDRIDALEEECRRLEALGDERVATLETRYTTRLAEVETALAALQDHSAGLQRVCDEQARALTEGAEREERARQALEDALARTTADQEETLRQARTMVEQAEAARAAAVAEVESLRQALAEAQGMILRSEDVEADTARNRAQQEEDLQSVQATAQRAEALRIKTVAEIEEVRRQLAAAQGEALGALDETRRVLRDLDRLRGEHEQTVADRAAIADALARAREHESELSDQITDLERTIDQLREEQRRAADQWRDQESALEARGQAQIMTIEASLDRAQRRAQELEREHERLAAELEAATATERRVRQELAATLERTANDREETLRHARDLVQAAEKARSAAVAETEAVRAALANAQQLILEAEDESRRAHEEIDRLTAAENVARSEQRSLEGALEEARARAGEAEARLEQAASQAAARPATAASKMPGMPSSPAPVVPRAARATPPLVEAKKGRRVLAVVDTDPSWTEMSGDKADVVVLEPTASLAAKFGELGIDTGIVNLATPGALQALTDLRAEGVTVPVIGCIAAPGAPNAILLGPVEAVARPPDPEALVTIISRYTSRGTRIVTAGKDANTFISVRQALTRVGMSVSIAWDAKQAEDLLPMVRPQVVVLDLALPPRGGCAIACSLADYKPTPLLVLIAGEAEPGDEFSALAARKDQGRGRDRVIRELLLQEQERTAVK